MTTRWAASFVLNPDGVTRTTALGADRVDRRLADALPEGDSALFLLKTGPEGALQALILDHEQRGIRLRRVDSAVVHGRIVSRMRGA